MDNQNKIKITLKEELKFLESYISILEIRYHNQFQVQYSELNVVSEFKIIPYTLQLLIENVTKHNVISVKNPMVINIEIGENKVIISNPIRQKINPDSNGIGLRYVSELYKSHGKDFEIENDGSTFKAKVPYL